MITVNRNTVQTPITSGRTGPQSIKFIPAPRVYIGPPDYSNPANVVFGLSNGNSPLGFVDLGVVEGAAQVSVARTTNQVFTGVDKLLRTVYSQSINGKISFSLSQFDDFVLENIAGITPTYSLPGVYANYQLGSQSLVPVALLLISQNKLDGKEWQFYNPTALLSFTIDTASDAMVLGVSGILPTFTGVTGAERQVLSVTILSGQATGYGVYGYGLLYGA